ncbi:MAG: ADP-glyceromanno-heptose 6-epimerase [Calditrichaeota bacterium]|nr:ADP-glyceromanno-heptose 6-epimerase [Calditrichota bacterium]
MQFIVTGGAGFIGSNVVKALNRRGEDDIIVVDHLNHPGKEANLELLRFRHYIEKADFRNRLGGGAFDDARLVIHMGACSSTTETDEDYLMDNNFRYSQELCRWCLRRGVRIVYASSAATYGDGSQGYSDDHSLIPHLVPLNLYGKSKLLFDRWAWETGALEQVAGIRYFNVFGPGEDHKGEMRSVVNKAFEQVQATGRIRLFKSYMPEYADGEQVRDFIYVEDAVAMTLYLLENPEVNGIFNCGAGQARSWNDLASAVCAAMDVPVNIEYIDMPEDMREKYQYHTEAVMGKIREAGYDATFLSLEEGVRHCAESKRY